MVKFGSQRISKAGERIVKGFRFMPELCRSLAGGTKKLRLAVVDYIRCPRCDDLIEVWDDEEVVTCFFCGADLSKLPPIRRRI